MSHEYLLVIQQLPLPNTHILPHALSILVALGLGDAHLVHASVQYLDRAQALLSVLGLLVQVLIFRLQIGSRKRRPMHLALRRRLSGRKEGDSRLVTRVRCLARQADIPCEASLVANGAREVGPKISEWLRPLAFRSSKRDTLFTRLRCITCDSLEKHISLIDITILQRGLSGRGSCRTTSLPTNTVPVRSWKRLLPPRRLVQQLPCSRPLCLHRSEG